MWERDAIIFGFDVRMQYNNNVISIYGPQVVKRQSNSLFDKLRLWLDPRFRKENKKKKENKNKNKKLDSPTIQDYK